MNAISPVTRDERTIAIENSSYKYAYFFLIAALFLDGVYRGILQDSHMWDFFLMFVAGGAVARGYQIHQKAVPDGWVRRGIGILVMGAAMGAFIAIIRAVFPH